MLPLRSCWRLGATDNAAKTVSEARRRSTVLHGRDRMVVLPAMLDNDVKAGEKGPRGCSTPGRSRPWLSPHAGVLEKPAPRSDGRALKARIWTAAQLNESLKIARQLCSM